MSIETYSELKTAIADYMHRSDLTTAMTDIVKIAEAKLNRHLRLLQSQQTASLVCVVSSRYVALPTRFQEAITLTITPTGGVPEFLEYKDGEEFDDRIQTSNGLPRIYRIDTQIEFDCPADTAYALALRYIKKWDIATDLTNYLLTNWPDLYLNAGIWAAAQYTRDWELRDMTLPVLMQGIEEANRIDGNTRGRAILSTPFGSPSKSRIESGE